MKTVVLAAALGGFAAAIAQPACSAEYYRQKWFDYPDPLTLPKMETHTGCAHWIKPWGGAKICTNPTHVDVKVALLRRDVVFTVSGPASSDQAEQRAVAGYAAGCAATSIAIAEQVGAAVPLPEPGSRIAAAGMALSTSFSACVTSVSMAGLLGGTVAQLHMEIDTSGSHWSPL